MSALTTMNTRPARPAAMGKGRKRLAVASRALAAVPGGYALAAGTTWLLARVVPGPRDEVVALATLPSYLLFAGAIIWCFSCRTAARAWLGIGVPGALVALGIWWLRAKEASP